MKKIIDTFEDYFNNEISLPNQLPEKGKIDDLNSGWYIRYILSKDSDGNLYLDFTAEHRMTNSRHHRITLNGELSFLEMYKEGYGYNDKIPGDKEKKEQEYFEHNREVSRVLIKKRLMDMKGNESLFKN